MTRDVIKDEEVTIVAEGVKPDDKNRVGLAKALLMKGVTYHVYLNRFGQIILDPQVPVPASEAWLFNNPDAIASVRRGLADVVQGKVSKIDPDTL